MLKNILSVLTGMIVGVAFIFLFEKLSHTLYPLPEGIDFNDPEVVKELMSKAPLGALLLVILASAIGAFTGGLTASLIANNPRHTKSIIVGCILLVAGIMNLIKIPHTLWFAIVQLLVYIPFVYFGYLVSLKLKPVDSSQ